MCHYQHCFHFSVCEDFIGKCHQIDLAVTLSKLFSHSAVTHAGQELLRKNESHYHIATCIAENALQQFERLLWRNSAAIPQALGGFEILVGRVTKQHPRVRKCFCEFS